MKTFVELVSNRAMINLAICLELPKKAISFSIFEEEKSNQGPGVAGAVVQTFVLAYYYIILIILVYSPSQQSLRRRLT